MTDCVPSSTTWRCVSGAAITAPIVARPGFARSRAAGGGVLFGAPQRRGSRARATQIARADDVTRGRARLGARAYAMRPTSVWPTSAVRRVGRGGRRRWAANAELTTSATRVFAPRDAALSTVPTADRAPPICGAPSFPMDGSAFLRAELSMTAPSLRSAIRRSPRGPRASGAGRRRMAGRARGIAIADRGGARAGGVYPSAPMDDARRASCVRPTRKVPTVRALCGGPVPRAMTHRRHAPTTSPALPGCAPRRATVAAGPTPSVSRDGAIRGARLTMIADPGTSAIPSMSTFRSARRLAEGRRGKLAGAARSAHRACASTVRAARRARRGVTTGRAAWRWASTGSACRRERRRSARSATSTRTVAADCASGGAARAHAKRARGARPPASARHCGRDGFACGRAPRWRRTTSASTMRSVSPTARAATGVARGPTMARRSVHPAFRSPRVRRPRWSATTPATARGAAGPAIRIAIPAASANAPTAKSAFASRRTRGSARVCPPAKRPRWRHVPRRMSVPAGYVSDSPKRRGVDRFASTTVIVPPTLSASTAPAIRMRRSASARRNVTTVSVATGSRADSGSTAIGPATEAERAAVSVERGPIGLALDGLTRAGFRLLLPSERHRRER